MQRTPILSGNVVEVSPEHKLDDVNKVHLERVSYTIIFNAKIMCAEYITLNGKLSSVRVNLEKGSKLYYYKISSFFR